MIESRRYQKYMKILKNEYVLGKISVVTGKNEPSKFSNMLDCLFTDFGMRKHVTKSSFTDQALSATTSHVLRGATWGQLRLS